MSESRSSGGISLFGAFGLMFVGLKLGNVIDWDWVWVLVPFWIPFVLALLAIIVMAIYYGFFERK